MRNLALNATYTMITNTEDATYTFANCFDEDKTTVGKPADADDTVVRIDLGSAVPINAVGIFNHTLGTNTATITFAYHDATPEVAATAWGDLTACGAFAPSVDNPDSLRVTDPQVVKRYLWFKITGQDAAV